MNIEKVKRLLTEALQELDGEVSSPSMDDLPDMLLPMMMGGGGDMRALFMMMLMKYLQDKKDKKRKPKDIVEPDEIPTQERDTEKVLDAKHISKAPSGMLWKPVSESRGGIPVLLTPTGWSQVTQIKLFDSDGQRVSVREVEERGLTNGDRETYFFHGIKANQLPKNLVVDLDQHGKYLIPDPNQRYE